MNPPEFVAFWLLLFTGFWLVVGLLVSQWRNDLCAHPIPETCPNCRDAE